MRPGSDTTSLNKKQLYTALELSCGKESDEDDDGYNDEYLSIYLEYKMLIKVPEEYSPL
jgi:hypothetical protein